MRLFREKCFGHLGLTVDLMGAVGNMEDVGYNIKTQSIDVISGVYVPRKHEQCLILMRPNAFSYRSGVKHLLHFFKSDDFVFLQMGGL